MGRKSRTNETMDTIMAKLEEILTIVKHLEISVKQNDMPPQSHYKELIDEMITLGRVLKQL
jgi:hypothetical protein